MPQSKQRVLSRGIILSTAPDLAGEEGLSALSLRLLGKRLGVSQTALYRHFPDKVALLEGISEQVWCLTFKAFLACVGTGMINTESTLAPEASTPTDGIPTSPLLTYMRTYAHCLASALRSHPGAVMLLPTYPMSTPEQPSFLVRMFVTLARRGFMPNADILGLVNVVPIYTTALVVAEAVSPVGGSPEQPTDLSAASDALDPEDAQALRPLIEDLLDGRHDFNAQSERGLEAILRGWV